MSRLREAELSQTIAEMRQKIAELEIGVSQQISFRICNVISGTDGFSC